MKTQNEVKHTPTPWVFDPEGLDIVDKPVADAVWIADLDTDSDRDLAIANGYFIVRAVNAYGPMLEHLKKMLNVLNSLEGDRRLINTAYDMACNVIKLAEGGK